MSTVEKSAVSRRKVAAGIAWSVPVIAAASVAPFAAASPGKCPKVTKPTDNTLACTPAQHPFAKFSYSNNGHGAWELEYYLRFESPALSAGQQLTFTFQISNVAGAATASATAPVGSFSFSVTGNSFSNSTNTLTVTATAPANSPVTAGTVHGVTIRLAYAGSTSPKNFSITGLGGPGASGCTLPSFLPITLPGHNDDLGVITQNHCGSDVKAPIYYY